MRHFQLLSKESLEVLAAIYEGMELSGRMPRQIELVLIALLPKGSGGYRPIGLFPAAYRLWGRCRRPLAAKWELDNERPYFAAGRHAGATDVVWRSSVRGECGVLQDEGSAAILWDMAKFYESFDVQLLESRAMEWGFPEGVLRLSCHAYRMARYFTLGGFVDGPHYAGRGVIVGRSIATSYVRIYTISSYDKIPRGILSVTS